MLLNTEKTNIMFITSRQKRINVDESILSLTYNDITLQIVTGDKILGVNMDQNLQWTNHFQAVCKKVSSYICSLPKVYGYLGSEHRLMFYNAYIHPHFNYCNNIWGNSSNYNVSKITKLQKRAFRIILGDEYLDFETAKSSLNILPFQLNVFLNKGNIMFKVANNLIPQYICELFQRRLDSVLNASLRSVSYQNFYIPKPTLSIFKQSLSYSGPIIWKYSE